ncbi:glutamate-5-semialdehyde dehydrogenase [Agaribacter marinus]|uniref:Gamma-glutamyl phosphate reductase n=1 Tax=Agaribacter marinus TaxID=1431249 RepID=A0AA37SZR8_9ALTE|nr:glutamate-5-semialdehyde dehydrogenase [Agaribacter marinus]GLR71379.1 gamma-glutamyl phosphate reductase [Agaribacter marinus]
MTFDIKLAAAQAKAAKNAIANLSQAQRLALLLSVAKGLRENVEPILAANKVDLDNAKESGLSDAMIDRLALNADGVEAIAKAVEEIAHQPEVLGSINNIQPLPSGIQVGKMRIPLGVIAMIYESRPNVTIDAAALCLKAGNAVILRGGKEAQASNKALASVLHSALEAQGLPAAIATVIPVPDREVMQEMLTLSESIDLIIPRGGEGLIRYVSTNSQIPVIQHFKGVCHLFIDKDADLDKAIPILENGKTQRTGVCNALETLLVHVDVATQAMPKVAALFDEKGVKVHACERAIGYLSNAEFATKEDWEAEYLALEIAVKIVDDFDTAVTHIQEYGSGHTEVIVTENLASSQRFMREVNSSVIMLNASSRFSDGGQLGLGAEIGISTSKLHAYGPMGAQQLTTEKFVVYGDGHIRV